MAPDTMPVLKGETILKKKQEESMQSYFIPQNIVENRTFFGGVVTIRKLLEAIVFGIFTGWISKGIAGWMGLGVTYTISTVIVAVGLVVCLCIAGINGDSFLTFLIRYFRYKTMKKVYTYLKEEDFEEWEKKAMQHHESQKKKRKKEKIKKENKKNLEQGISKDVPKKSRRQLKKELLEEKRRKAREEKIKASLIAGGMDPVKAASINVFEQEEKEQEEKESVEEKEESTFVETIREIIEYYQNYMKETEEWKGLPPITTNTVNFLPIQSMYAGIYEMKDHRYVKFVEVKPTNYNLRSTAEKQAILDAFFGYIRVAPVNFQIKCVSRKVDTRGHVKKAKHYMEMETNEKCKEMQMDTIRMLENMAESGSIEHRFYLVFDHFSYGVGNDERMKAIQTLYDVAATAIDYLQRCDLEVLEPDNMTQFAAETLYSQLNRKESVHMDFEERKMDVAEYYMKTFKNPERLSEIPIGELIGPKTIDFEKSPKYYTIDGRYYAHFYVNGGSIGNFKYGGWVSSLINSGEGVDIDLFFSKKDKGWIINRLNFGIQFGAAGVLQTNEMNETYEWKAGKLYSQQYIRSGLQNSDGLDFYYMSILATISADSREELKTKIKGFTQKCKASGYKIENCDYMQDRGFLSSLPLGKLDPMIAKRAKRNMLTDGVASAFPFISNELSDDDGIVIGVDEVFHNLMILDVFNDNKYPNANAVMFGTSGAGKTYTLLLLAMRMRQQGIPIFLIAPLKAFEFKRACRAIGGQYITISPASNQCINPMDIRLADTSNADLLDGVDVSLEMSALTQKIGMLKTLFALIKPDITKKELNILDDALVETYKRKGITHENDSLFISGTKKYKTMPILGDVYEVIEQKEPIKGEDLLDALKKYVFGSAKNFNQQTNVDLDNMFSVFDVEHLEKETLPVGMFIATDFVWAKAKEDRTKKKAIIMDELWKLIGENRIAAEYIIEIFKIIRSYGGAAIAATQSSNDMKKLDNGQYGKEIVNCSSLKFILRLEKEEAENIQDIFDFTEAEIQKIKKFKQGHCLLMSGGNNIPVHIIATKKEHDLITTKRSDSEKLVQKKREKIGA